MYVSRYCLWSSGVVGCDSSAPDEVDDERMDEQVDEVFHYHLATALAQTNRAHRQGAGTADPTHRNLIESSHDDQREAVVVMG